MSKKKILVVAEYLSGRGGTEKVLQDFYWYYKKKYEIEFLLLNSNESEIEWLKGIEPTFFFDLSEDVKSARRNNIFYRFFLQGGFKNFYKRKSLLKKIQEVILNNRPDVVISTGYSYLGMIRSTVNKYKVDSKIIYWDHMAHCHYRCKDKELVQNIYLADHYFAISRGIKQSLINLNIPKDKISLIFNPIQRNEETKFSIKKNKFIYVGRLISGGQKRCLDILHAMKKIDQLNFTVEFYGDGDDKDFLIKESQILGIEDKAILKGWVNKPWDEIEEASCLLLTSEYEGFGLVLAEAISYGIPCISSRCNYGPEDIIIPKISGGFFEVGDIDTLSLLMKKFIDSPDQFVCENKIKPSIEHLYSDLYFKNLEDILSKLLCKNSY